MILPPSQSHQSISSPSASRSDESATTEEITQEIRQSSHAELDCSDCHAPADKNSILLAAEPKTIGKADCGHCHQIELKAYEQSVHAQALARGKRAPPIVPIVTGHIYSSRQRPSLARSINGTYPKRAVFATRTPRLQKSLGSSYPTRFKCILTVCTGGRWCKMASSLHRPARTVTALATPSGALMILRSTVHRNNIPQTCGRCHVGPLGEYAIGIHGKKLAEGDKKAPVCSDCHTAHEIVGPTGKFKLASDALCGKCHLPRLRQYLQTYHGRAHDLGSQTVAACFDCHGTHAILPVSDPSSTLSAANRLTTCRKCHAGASAKFTSYRAHADYEIGNTIPLFTGRS